MIDDRLIRIEGKLDQVVDRIGSIDTTLASQHEVLNEHIRRTAALEAIVIPMHERSILLRGGFKAICAILGLIAGLIAFVSGVVEIITYIKTGSL